MSPAKRSHTSSDSSNLQDDWKNYGTAASMRPSRSTKRPWLITTTEPTDAPKKRRSVTQSQRRPSRSQNKSAPEPIVGATKADDLELISPSHEVEKDNPHYAYDIVDAPVQVARTPPRIVPFPTPKSVSSDESKVEDVIPPKLNDAATSLSLSEPNDDSLNLVCSDQSIQKLAQQIHNQRHHSRPKPEPSGHPEVWADGRQELCETLHYFRAYQSACHSNGGFVRGCMFDKVAHARDYIDKDVIISRAGGGMTKDKETGEMKSARDQVEGSAAQGLKNCMTHYNPVVMIIGADNPHIPSQPPHQYCVLDYFKPTHIWTEKSGTGKVVRYRFEKLNVNKPSWWHPKDEELLDFSALPPPVEQCCGKCGIESLQVYINGWMCLQPTCVAFWKTIDTDDEQRILSEPDEGSLIYDPRFLKQKTPWPNDDHEYSLNSNYAELSGYSIPGEDTSSAFWQGQVCPKCGRCNSRLSWLGWSCQNVDCSYNQEPPHIFIPATALRDPLWPLTTTYTMSRDVHSPLIGLKVIFSCGYRINQYTIPGIEGFITHMIANKTVVSELGGPDAMFEELQETDIGLQRRPLPTGQLKGTSYCRHFLVNYGMPYKFIAATASHSFTNAARPVIATRSRLNWAAQHLLSLHTGVPQSEVKKSWTEEKEFNEVLALGYFESQKINFHDDGEHGLGPTIATLSLGATGTMRIRMKARHYHGISCAGSLYDDLAPIPGCEKYAERLALQRELDTLKASDSKAWNRRRREIPQELKLKSTGNAKEVLNMAVGHGDIVVMHGADLQKYYEHAVEHSGKLRFALTCRYIDPKSLKEADRPGYVVERDQEGYDGSKLV